jgi:hypothetical protein
LISFLSFRATGERKNFSESVGNGDVESCPGYLKKGVELMEAELVAWSKHLPIRGQTVENISEP